MLNAISYNYDTQRREGYVYADLQVAMLSHEDSK